MKYIELTRGYKAIIDDADYDHVMQYKWHADVKQFKNGHLYVRAQARIWNKEVKKYKQWRLHNWIMHPPPDFVVNHLNHNPLDNRRINLEVCTQSENIFDKIPSARNRTSKYRGVSYDKHRNKWKAYVTKDGKHIQLGRYETEKGAATAWNLAIANYFPLNYRKWLNKIK